MTGVVAVRSSVLPFLPLVKVQALGNDFLLVRTSDLPAKVDLAELTRRACSRRRGIGADGLMTLEDTVQGAKTTLVNADGSAAELSGNGVRCAAAWIAHVRDLNAGAVLQVETAAGVKTLELLERDGPRSVFRAAMGQPEALRQETLTVDGEAVPVVVLRMGNPQCVVLGEVSLDRLHRLASQLAAHPAFPAGTNVELAMVEAPDRIRILIWERGVGPTEASGTGACAAAVAAAAFGRLGRTADVMSPGGTQRVEWTDQGVWLTGWAELCGRIDWWGAGTDGRAGPLR